MKIINAEQGHIKSWCMEPEDGAIEQATNLTKLPFLFHHVALMPDTHQGYGMPIGGVIACQNVIIPNAVGVDIGCGMLAVQTSLRELPADKLKEIIGYIRKAVPVGFNRHETSNITVEMFQDLLGYTPETAPIIHRQEKQAILQLGTLGGGNHFIEIQKGSDGFIWFMIHSGSRNLGYKVAKYYNDLTKTLNKDWYTSVDVGADLAFLPMNSDAGKAYRREMEFCLAFAKCNRRAMANEIKQILSDYDCAFFNEYDVHHNYAAMENHFGKNVMVHRKGATSAKKGEIGIIPGSQGTASYIVEGKGNLDSFTSCSHGAGRKMSRKKARNILQVEKETKLLNEKGILHSIRDGQDLDEAPGAYKDIDVVMEEQQDLVSIVTKLEPLAVIKG